MADFANRFRIRATDVVRIAFFDEGLALADGDEAPVQAQTEKVMSRADALELGETLVRLLKPN